MGSCVSKGPEAPVKAAPAKSAASKRQEHQNTVSEAETSGNSLANKQSSTTTTTGANGVASSSTDVNKAAGSSSNGVAASNGVVSNGNGSANGNGTTSNSGDRNVKVLLLGSGESGKSTIVKQMKILHQNGYTKEELYEYRPFVYRNVLECIKNVISAIIDLEPQLIKENNNNDLEAIKSKEEEVQKSLAAIDASSNTNDNDNDHDTNTNNNNNNDSHKTHKNNDNELEDGEIDPNVSDTRSDDDEIVALNGDSKGLKVRASEKDKIAKKVGVLDYDELNDILDYEFTMNVEDTFDQNIANKIINVYNKPEVQDFIKYQQGNFYLIDSTHYFLRDVKRISSPDFIPSVNDVLRTRKKTSGIFDFEFQMSSGLNIHMYDVGGQRSERKKWIHCFDNVTLIIFCVALSEYDQVLLEENSQNRLVESLTLFDSVVNSRWFSRTSIVLFLNKIDVFAEKLPYSPLENHFPDYTGGNNINKAAKYILWRFTQVNRSGLNIYPHVTQATDTSNIQLVFAAVKETILENSLRDSGLL